MSIILFVFFLSFFSLFVFRKVAKRIGLVDKPNERKQHVGQIPLIGGISIFSTLLITLAIFFPVSDSLLLYCFCSFILVFVGVVDDKVDLSFKLRLFIQVGISLTMIIIGHKSLNYLGFIFSGEALHLPLYISYVLTVFAVIGAINAFNMVDGIDGLLGGLSSVTFAALGYMFYLSGKSDLAIFCMLFIAAIVPYVLLNLGLPFGKRFKVFMGDAGSMFIGFTVIWLLIEASQDDVSLTISPVTALWFISIPLMDMVSIMIRRIKKGQSPFKPDREHLHHICQRLGMSSRASLFFICLMSAIMACVGIWSELHGIDESIMFLIFILIFSVYLYVISHIWRITTFLHKHLKFTLP
ncbi:UDP-N-acetylglucosamine--undecaprenyl-phosphate N-acetylglucosaminephosphotransferase [Shewanella aestuarii]|uniref:Undecaprenyl-phosphate alpha-N-acetylglucosaminyl 1-phosphate transferase n=1 Tax=Shewanella aestuarii TaxID=1028752 RepID=A0A6G9QKN6_9GAMM|nr:UDP-N-acetylglucosamine--undecaprenyl-phosphate N-acetylglucosaminephosphotransferase [Shewanella aestuarii]QIR15096.1 UDP-N-acetylglucosamine--undecaprenyl-phosphate N-acetylglucosaminephosphotransferase [Shewanella aestuarii]